MSERVLVVAAHPDDEVLGVGGTMARHASEGDVVTVLILGEGAVARDAATRDEVATLESQARRANAILGVTDVRFAKLPDNRFDRLDLLDIVKAVEAVVSETRPALVYTHHAGDLNVDHRLTAHAVITATRPVPGSPVREVAAFEVASSTEWAFGQIAGMFTPNAFRDISTTLERKLEALGCYAAEMAPAPHPRSPEVVRAMAVRWGSVAGRMAAEAFEIVRIIR
jgi:LmbE family N-acetylglucosaminyl deacetylase